MATANEVERVFDYDKIADRYDALSSLPESFASKHRQELLCLEHGSVLKVGVGTGESLKDYPPQSNVVAVDISREMLRRARPKARAVNLNTGLAQCDVRALPFPDKTFDTVFTYWAFCAAAEPLKGLQEMARVAREGGRLLMLEHVKSSIWLVGGAMEAPNPFVAMIDNINRDAYRICGRRAGPSLLIRTWLETSQSK